MKKIKNKEIKVLADVNCPECNEKYSFYMSNEHKKKGILAKEYFYEGFFDSHYGNRYDCYTCGHHWIVRESKKSFFIKIFPFLENK